MVEKAAKDRLRARVQWYRVPIMTAIILSGVYFIRQAGPWLYAGMGITLFGELWQMWAASHLRKDKSLATSGPYAYVRNPMYFGRFFVLLGFSIMVGQSYPPFGLAIGAAVYSIIFALYVTARVGREEARLFGIFGGDYTHYRGEVPRFVPRLRRYSKATSERAQWSKVVTNHEYLNVIAAFAVFGMILLRINFLR